jgi:hypothetical protein
MGICYLVYEGGIMKDDLPYFSHDNNSHTHPKMKALIAQYGMAGYGMFWVLNEKIASSPGAALDISRKVNKLDLAQELGIKGEEIDGFIDFLSDPEIDLINVNGGIITTDRTQENYQHVMEIKKKEREKYENRKGKEGREEPGGEKEDSPGETPDSPGKEENSPGENTQIKLNKIKGNKRNIIISQNSEESLDLAKIMLLEHRKEIPDFMTGKKDEETIKRWAQDIEKLIRIDKKSPENIGKVIMWVKTPGNFWFHNIESGMKLRKQYERLYGQMISVNGQGPPSTSPGDKKSLGGLEL